MWGLSPVTVALLCALTASLGAQTKLGKVTTLQLGKGQTAQHVWVADLDGNGRDDVVLAAYELGKDYRRSLRVHLHKKTPHVDGRPDITVALPRTVVACALGDVHPDPGSEILWFGARGVYAWRRKAPEAERVVKLVSSEFLFQFPDTEEVYSWQAGVRDVDGDGLPDLVLPEPRGYRVAIQRRTAGKVTFQTSELRVPPRPPKKQGINPLGVRSSTRGETFKLDTALDAYVPRPPLVNVAETVPAPQLYDWDADGDVDVIARSGERMFVWLQQRGGSFEPAPTHGSEFPLTDEQITLDPSFSVWLCDFDRDLRVDSLLFAKDRDSSDIRTQVLFFKHLPKAEDPLFNKGVPKQLIVLAGFPTSPALDDIDGNGLPDLSVISWRVDVLDQLTAGEERSIDVELYVFLNRRGQFSRHPNLTFKTTLEGDVLRRGGARLFARFVGDVTGDGIRELLVRDRPERIRLHLIRRRGDDLTVFPRPLWEMTVAEQAIVRFPERSNGPVGFFVMEANQVLWVTF